MSARPGARVLVTGATGFIGRAVVPQLAAAGYRPVLMIRDPARLDAAGLNTWPHVLGHLPDGLPDVASVPALDGIIHLAGLAHAEHADHDHARVTVAGTAQLLAMAKAAGVQRFVFVSSVRAVVGANSPTPITEASAPAPDGAYGQAKREAEIQVLGAQIPAVVLRPVAVYGPGVGANLGRIGRLAASPWPLPLASLTAPRSLIARETLADAILFALNADRLCGQTCLVADPEPLSVAQLVRSLRHAMGRKGRLFPVPAAILRPMIGARAAARLMEPLVVAPERLRDAGWRPPRSQSETLAAWAESLTG